MMGTVRRAAVPPPRRHREPWPLLCWLLPLASWLALVVTGWCSLHRPARTGDPLLDAALHELARPDFSHVTSNLADPVPLWRFWYVRPRRSFAAFEPRFGQDARFWELRYTLGDEAIPDLDVYRMRDSKQQRYDYWFEQAQQRGVTSPALQLQAALDKDSAGYEATQEFMEASGALPPRFNQTGQTVNAVTLDRAITVRSHVPATETERFKQQLLAVQTAVPDEALPYYVQAELSAERGDAAAALRLVAAGNQRRMSDALLTYPAAMVRRELVAGQMFGDNFAGGRLMLGGSTNLYPTADRFQAVMAGLADGCLQRHDLSDLQQIHLGICRCLGEASRPRRVRQTGLAIEQELRNLVQTRWVNGLTADQLVALRQLDAVLQQMDAVHNSLNQQSHSVIRQHYTTQAAPAACLLRVLSGGLSAQMDSSELFSAVRPVDPAANDRGLVPLWQTLERFDYSRLAWTGGPPATSSPAAAPPP